MDEDRDLMDEDDRDLMDEDDRDLMDEDDRDLMDEDDRDLMDEDMPAMNIAPMSQAALSCNGATCNGRDPVAYGCTGDAVTPTNPQYAKKYIYEWWTNISLGYVQMRYSAKCNAQWGEVYNYKKLAYSKVALRSINGSITYSSPVYHTNVTTIRTTMRATPNPGYRVDGGIDACTTGCDSGGYNWVIW